MEKPGDFEKIKRKPFIFESKNKSDDEIVSFKCFPERVSPTFSDHNLG